MPLVRRVVSDDRWRTPHSPVRVDVAGIPASVRASEGRADVRTRHQREAARAHDGSHPCGRARAGVGYDKPAGSGGRGVRRAQSLGVLRPALVLELHPERNGALDPYAIGVRSGRKLWWRCATCGHDWQAAPHERSRGGGCPRCAQEKRNAANRHVTNERSLAVKRPDLVAELHPSLNLELDAYTLGAGSGQLVWWLCRVCGHAWKAAPASRARGRGCPRCGRRRTAAASARSQSRVPPERSLARKRPELARELHPTCNRELDPLALAPYSNREIWWLCPTCGNEWKRAPNARRAAGRCPACRAR